VEEKFFSRFIKFQKNFFFKSTKGKGIHIDFQVNFSEIQKLDFLDPSERFGVWFLRFLVISRFGIKFSVILTSDHILVKFLQILAFEK